MTGEQIRDYLYAVIDAEKNKYIQKKTIERLQENANVLGIKPKRQPPVHYKADFSIDATTPTLAALGTIVFIAGIIIFAAIAQTFQRSSSQGVVMVLGIITSITLSIISVIRYSNKHGNKKAIAEQQRLDEEYEGQLREYKNLLIRDEAAFDIEIDQKRYIYRQINLLKEQLKKTNDELNELYNYNVIDKKYWHDIVALYSFYEYFRLKRTYSLHFDPKTGDEGAYEKYEKESRMDGFIKRADIIIKKLDRIIDNQKSTAAMIMEASNKVDNLSANVMNASKQITGTIEDNAAIIRYNQERQIALDKQRNNLIFLDVLSNIDRKN